ncbi:hypothetical protein TNIN_6161 [Trichonephila inaurata madagascariensis]|uniref:Uncharacterized protein n=1 Tax=Trichonephila inaurata madagascariensis TaxID=2747483 RepID=A0A8X7CN61_9ARAC|nr:hypothetical protein TNIN_6161 [Trichonephila inaurata madagascariensis]
MIIRRRHATAMTIINISLTELRCLSFNKYDKREALFRCNWLSSVYLLKLRHSHMIMSHTKRWKLPRVEKITSLREGRAACQSAATEEERNTFTTVLNLHSCRKY